jgi:hypothetical protein
MAPKTLLSPTVFFLTRTNKRLERKRKQHNSKKKKSRVMHGIGKRKESKHGWLAGSLALLLLCISP